jgi:uncharacterized membrane protein (DUF106 family)
VEAEVPLRERTQLITSAEGDVAADKAASLPAPRGLTVAWIVLVALTAAEGVHQVFQVGSPGILFDDWFHDTVIAAAAGLVLLRAAYEPVERAAWTAMGLGLLFWAGGEILWSLVYEGEAHPPYPTWSDPLWLAWYPLTAVGVALLIKRHVIRFELHRWMDGVAVMLVVLTPGVAALVQPVAERSADDTLATVVDFSYPILDILLVGAILGVYGLTAWRPSRTWFLLGIGCVMFAAADAVFAVEQARTAITSESYDFVWTAGALVIAYAAWSSVPSSLHHGEAVGWRAIALPLAAQVLAAGIQIYGLFEELGTSERVVTLVVLIIAMLQIILSRPRAGDEARGP